MSLDRNLKTWDKFLAFGLGIKQSNSRKIWNVGLGDGSGMLRFLQRMIEIEVNNITHFDHVIRISIPSLTNGTTKDNYYATRKSAMLAIANALNLMDEDDSKLRKWKNKLDEESYYHYKPIDQTEESGLINEMKQKIYGKLGGKRNLIILENLLQPLNDPINRWLMEGWLPIPFAGSPSWWVISASSREVCTNIEGEEYLVLDLQNLINSQQNLYAPRPGCMFEVELWHAAKSISTISCTVTRNMDILWSCLLYTQLLSPVDNHKLSLSNNTQKRKENNLNCIEPKELIQFWISEGLFTRKIKLKHATSITPWDNPKDILTSLEEEEAEEEEEKMTTKLFEFAKTILHALISHSLLQPYHHPTISVSSSDTFIPFSGMWQLLLHWSSNRWGLLTENNSISHQTELVNKSWISFASDSCKWIQFPKPNKTTTIILRGRQDISQSIVETLISNMPCLRVLDLSYTSIESLPHSLSRIANLRFLSLKGCQHLKTLLSCDSCPIGSLERLEVLDFHGVPLTEIPIDVGYKKEKLYFLDLSSPTIVSIPSNLFQYMANLLELVLLGCKSLTALPPLDALTNLEIFSLSETKLVSLPPDAFRKMLRVRVINLINNYFLETLPESLCEAQNLEVLNLSETRLISLPSNTFNKMLRLQVLKLINNNLLETLPKSLCEAQNLEELDLNGCKRLNVVHALPTKSLRVFNLIGNEHITSLPESLTRSHNVRELNVSDCQSLTEIKMRGHVSLRTFTLSHSPVRSLSLRGCRKLEVVILHDLDEIEELDLSATAIKELPIEISGLSSLRKLDLEAVPHLRRVPWHKLHRVPEVFNIDQCEHVITSNSDHDVQGEISGMRQPLKTGVQVHISVWDSRLFSSFGLHCLGLVKRGESLQSFDILVSSCAKRKAKMDKSSKKSIQSQADAPSYYQDARLKILTPKPPPTQQLRRRHLEISSTEQYPYGLNGILEITESLSVKDNVQLSSITDLKLKLPMLQILWVEQCHRMRELFLSYEEKPCNQLQILHVYHLQNIITLLNEFNVRAFEANFGMVKDLYISRCPRLKSVFPDNLILPNLETLTITHCDRLQVVFYKSLERPFATENRLRSIRSIRFQEVPQLLHFYEEQHCGPLQIPEWKTLNFQGCWSLRQLPLLTGPRDQKVCVEGQIKQCNKIKTQMEAEQLFHYEFKSPPPIASFKDGVKNRIFLK